MHAHHQGHAMGMRGGRGRHPFGRAGGQWQRSADLLNKLLSSGKLPSSPRTAKLVFSALEAGKQVERTQALLEALRSLGADPEFLVPASNALARVLARSGQAAAAYVHVERMVSGQETVYVEAETFSILCTELLKQGKGEKAVEALEWRDYLNDDEQ